jgi:Concanavalin A-like lectin/glucanases superfamily
LSFPTTDLTSNEFSAAFWMKVDATPDRAGVLTMGPPGINTRTHGFRFFRENAGGKQRFKLNVGNGTADSWFDGGTAADVDPTLNEWVHLAFTISDTQCVVYINGVVVSSGSFTGVDWAGCDILSIMPGEPRFSEWGHLSDESYMDELRIFDKALSLAEVQAVMND